MLVDILKMKKKSFLCLQEEGVERKECKILRFSRVGVIMDERTNKDLVEVHMKNNMIIIVKNAYGKESIDI